MRLRGISVTCGNIDDIDDIDRARNELSVMARRFGPRGLKVYPGADEPSDLGVETAASAALTQALKRERLTILALGAMTNVATVLFRHPELADRIARVIAVAGRRPVDRFAPGKGWVALRDLNFESDPRAPTIARRLLTSVYVLIILTMILGSPDHWVDPRWSLHASVHLFQGLSWLIGLCVIALIIIRVPLARGERWAWWTLLCRASAGTSHPPSTRGSA